MEYRFSDKIASLKPSAIREVLKATSVPGMIPFAAGNPAPDAFPVAEVQEIAADILKNRPIDALQYGVTEGYPELISLIKTRMKAKDGIGRDFDSIIITSGSFDQSPLQRGRCRYLREPVVHRLAQVFPLI